jgi:exosortase/archaeosortase family protein
MIAVLSALILAPFGDASASGNDITFNRFGASVVPACDGVQPTYIYIAAVLAFPSRWRVRGWGMLIGVPAIFTMNLLRVITMLICGAYWPALFERVHVYVWQTLVIAFTMAVWVFWAELFARPRYQAAS